MRCADGRWITSDIHPISIQPKTCSSTNATDCVFQTSRKRSTSWDFPLTIPFLAYQRGFVAPQSIWTYVTASLAIHGVYQWSAGSFLGQLCGPLGLCPRYTPQDIVIFLDPEQQVFLQTRLWRAPLRPLRGDAPQENRTLVAQLGNLISVKGDDIMLSTPSSQLVKFHRLRSSIPPRLWKWRIVSGWKWRGAQEHINVLEMRAVLTTLKCRVCHKRMVGSRFLHLVDSLVVMHSLARGRSSSRKLRSTLSRINALLLCSSNQALWGYVRTDLNPADRPSRWGTRIRTKFRNA